MKIIISLALCILTIMNGAYTQQFKIEGKIKPKTGDNKIVIHYFDGKVYQNDSAILKNGKFSLAGNIASPTIAWMELNPTDDQERPFSERDIKQIFLDPGSIKMVSADHLIRHANIKGGVSQEEFAELQLQLKPLVDQINPLNDSARKYWKKNDSLAAKFQKMAEPVYKKTEEVKNNFIDGHPDSYVSISLLEEQAVIIDPALFEPAFMKLSERVRQSASGKNLAGRLASAKRTAVGEPAIIFEQNDTTGKRFSLASLKGKYVLIDFWASWCGPCRAQNPFLVKAYEKFRDRNFEIFSVSLDSQRAAWLKAIRQDNLEWVHGSDLNGFENIAAKDYGIQAIPQNFLLDPEGIIIAKNIDGPALEEKLAELMKAE